MDFLITFIEGIISFISPCMLPMLPIYVTYFAGGADKNGYTFPIYHDTSYNASFAYNVSSIPQTLFINSSGELVHSQIGMMSEAAILSNIEKIR